VLVDLRRRAIVQVLKGGSGLYPRLRGDYLTAPAGTMSLTAGDGSLVVGDTSCIYTDSGSNTYDLAAIIAKTLIDAKGDLIAGTADNTVGRLAVGADGKSLVAASGETTGLSWAYPDHGTLGGLTDDDHTQYPLLLGRSGGQSLYGGTQNGDQLNLFATSGSGGKVNIGYMEGIIVDGDNSLVAINVPLLMRDQIIYGDDDAGDSLYLQSTSHATKGTVDVGDGLLIVDEANTRVQFDDFGTIDLTSDNLTFVTDTAGITWTNKVYSSAGATDSVFLGFARARGSQASPAAVQSGDRLGQFVFGGNYDASHAIATVNFLATATENWSSSQCGTLLRYDIVLNGTTTLVQAFNLSGYGTVLFNNSNNDIDLQWKSTTSNYGIFGDAANNKVGIGKYPAYQLDVAGEIGLKERSSDPGDPAEGCSVIWQSDGTGSGDDGDIMIKVTAASTTKTATLLDFSAA
jgi:hypothetical protein